MVSLRTRSAKALAEVSSSLPGGGEHRAGQIEMTEAIGDAIDAKKHLVVTAGTGTGKSLAYAIPAALSGKRTIIATATKALQDQLANKDLPFLQEVVDTPFEFAVLKGRSNYVCQQQLDELADTGNQMGLDGLEDEDGVDDEQLVQIRTWAKKTETGDRAELDFEPNTRTWAAVSVGPTECPGKRKCAAGERCFAEWARERALEADITVVNTHLYALDLVTEGAILGEHEVVVIDEAHQLEDICLLYTSDAADE